MEFVQVFFFFRSSRLCHLLISWVFKRPSGVIQSKALRTRGVEHVNPSLKAREDEM